MASPLVLKWDLTMLIISWATSKISFSISMTEPNLITRMEVDGSGLQFINFDFMTGDQEIKDSILLEF